MDLSIIIVSWNTRALLAECLDSIYTQPPQASFEVWVVDNASTDGTSELLAARYPQVHLIQNYQNSGFASANNQGITASQGRYVLLLNPDTKVFPQALDTLIAQLDQYNRLGAVGPLVLNPDGSLQASCYPRPTLGRELWRLLHLDRLRLYGVYDQTHWDRTQVRPVEVIQGCCLLLRRSALNEIGILDPAYFMYTEEVDLCYRLQRGGWGLAWVPQAQIIHYGGQSTQQVASAMFLRLYESKLIFFRKNYGALSAFAYKLILFVIALFRLIASPLALLGSPEKRQRTAQLAGNYWQMLRALPGM